MVQPKTIRNNKVKALDYSKALFLPFSLYVGKEVKMEKKEFKKLSLEELITYSKQKETPSITIIENVTDKDFKYIDLISERLFIDPIIVKKTNMIAFVGNSWVIRKIAKDIHKRCQTMFYDFAKRPSRKYSNFCFNRIYKVMDCFKRQWV